MYIALEPRKKLELISWLNEFQLHELIPQLPENEQELYREMMEWAENQKYTGKHHDNMKKPGLAGVYPARQQKKKNLRNTLPDIKEEKEYYHA